MLLSEITSLDQVEKWISQFLEDNQRQDYFVACKELFQKAYEEGEVKVVGLLAHVLDEAILLLPSDEQKSESQWLYQEINNQRYTGKTLLHGVLIQEDKFKNEELEVVINSLFKYSDFYQPTQDGTDIVTVFSAKNISKKYKTKIANEFGAFFVVSDNANPTESYPYTSKIEKNGRYYLIPDYAAIADLIDKAETLTDKEAIISKFECAMTLAHHTLEKHDFNHDLVDYYNASNTLTNDFYQTFNQYETNQNILDGYLAELRSNRFSLNQNAKAIRAASSLELAQPEQLEVVLDIQEPKELSRTEKLIQLAYYQRQLKLEFSTLPFVYKDEMLGRKEGNHFHNLQEILALAKKQSQRWRGFW